jgi:hypothetical protein
MKKSNILKIAGIAMLFTAFLSCGIGSALAWTAYDMDNNPSNGLDNWGSGVQTAVAGNGDGYGNFYYVYWWSCSYWDTNKGSYTIQPMYYTWLYDQTYYRNNQQYSGSQIDGGLTANVGAASSYVSRQFYRPDPPYPVIYWTYSTFSAIS